MASGNKFTGCIRWTTFIADCLIWLGGSSMLGLGIWVTTQETEYKHLSKNLYVTIGYIAISSFVFLIGFIGACSILLLKGKLLKLYFTLLFILFLAELGIALYFYLERDKIEGHIKTNWNSTDDNTRILIQKKLLCCSMKPLIQSHQSSNDKSCFKDENTSGERLEDCYARIKTLLKTNYMVLATVAAAVAAVQMFVLAGTCHIIANLESGNLVKQTRVVPFDGQTNKNSSKHTRRLAGQRPPSESSNAEADFEEEELPLERTTDRKAWAKRDPKYEAVFSKT